MRDRSSSIRHQFPAPGLALAGGISLLLLAAGCETRQEWLTKSRVQKVERSLLRAINLKGQRPEKLSLDSRMQFYKVPGVAIAVMDKTRLEWARGYGLRDARSREPVTLDTMFQAGDLSQPLAAAAALRLVDEGRLELDADIGSRLTRLNVSAADLGESGKLTLRQVLTRTGRSSQAGLPGYPQSEKPPRLIDLVRGGGLPGPEGETTAATPAKDVRTGDAGFAALELVLEDVTARPFASLMKATVLDRLAMSRSTFDVPLPEPQRINAASGHGRDGRPLDAKWFDYPAAAARGLWTTPSDLISFASDILETAMGNDGKVVSALQARAMLSAQAGNRSFGFSVEGAGQDVRFGLEGRTLGFTCSLAAYPYKGQGVVIMTNCENGFLLAEEILRSVSTVYEWPDFKPQERPLFRLDPSIYRQYVGRYEVTPDYILDVAYEDYYLVIRPTGQAPTKFFVESQTFFFSVDPYVRIQFLSDEKGRITGLILWQQDFRQAAKKIG